MSASEIRIVRLDSSTESDFWFLMEAEPFGWCFCCAWAVPTWDGWGERTAEQNRAVRAEMFARGLHDGYLLFAAERVAGWCQCGPRGALPKLERQLGRERAPAAHAITCFVIRPELRRQGLARQLLEYAIEDLAGRGVRRVEAYPKRGNRLEDGEVWTGPESLYLKAGFRAEGGDENRLVLVREL